MTTVLTIPAAVPPALLAALRERLDRALWRDGRATAGNLDPEVKRNEQLGEDDPLAAELGRAVVSSLFSNASFVAAALPARISPPIFNRYAAGGAYGRHIDGAIRPLAGAGRMRTDLSATLFIDSPDDYDGGELIIESTTGEHSVKLGGGDLVLYEATTIHQVAAVTRGVRRAAVFWVQSLVRDAGRRSLLYDLDQSIQRLRAVPAASGELLPLTAAYHNLLRMWADP
jgi:PKHD-type hydroxylase